MVDTRPVGPMTAMKRRTIRLVRDEDEREYQVAVVEERGELHATVDGRTFQVIRDGDGRVRVASDRTVTAWTVATGNQRWVFVDGDVFLLSEARPEERTRSRGHHGSLAAPMPATVRRVLVKPEDTVHPGDPLIILEAMKMELPIRATADGVVRAVNCREGELVQPGVTLVDIVENGSNQQ